MVPVKLGIRNDSVTEIREGIDGGDRVVVRGQTNLTPGTLVQLVE
jgi:multidrug efflux pump subunit AcrA (membrane-fusion protein)